MTPPKSSTGQSAPKKTPPAAKKMEEKKKTTGPDPRNMTPKERRLAFLELKKAKDKGDDWRIVRADVEEERTPMGILTLDNTLQLGGLPRRGRVIQLHGPEHGGKSTVCAKIVANYQAQTGEPAVINDFEGTLSWKYLQALGVDPDLAELYTPDSVDVCCQETLKHMLNGTRLFVFDSIPHMKEKIDAKTIMQGKAFKPNYAAHAKTMQRFFDVMIPHAKEHNCTFLMVNQERDRIDSSKEAESAQKYPSFTNLPYILPGGRASRYLMSAMIEVSVRKAWKTGKSFAVGGAPTAAQAFILGPELQVGQQGPNFYATEIGVRILKNKMSGGGYRGGTLWMRPGLGIDDYISVRQMALEYDLIFSPNKKKWIVGDAASPIITYNTKEDALEDLVFKANPEILNKLKLLVAERIDNDKTNRFAATVDEQLLGYMEGKEAAFGDGDDEIITKNVNIDTDDEL